LTVALLTTLLAAQTDWMVVGPICLCLCVRTITLESNDLELDIWHNGSTWVKFVGQGRKSKLNITG